MSRVLGGWRTALRIARREARRGKGRAVLVVAMITLPLAALAYGAVTYDTFHLTTVEKGDRMMGAADAALAWPADEPVEQSATETDIGFQFVNRSDPKAEHNPPKDPSTAKLTALLPSGSRVIPFGRGELAVRTAAGYATMQVWLLDLADPMARGILRPRTGRAPADRDEAAVTPTAAQRLGAGVGGTVRSRDGSRTLKIVGIVENPGDLTESAIVVRPEALPAAAGPDSAAPPGHWLAKTPKPLTWNQVKELNRHGVVAVSRYVLAHPPPPGEVPAGSAVSSGGPGERLALAVIVAGLALLEVVLLAGPAFAVGARRRRRDLALVAAAGGTPAHLRRIVLADGVVLGGLAAVAGLALGVAGAVAGRGLAEEHLFHSRSGGLRVFPLALAAIAVLAVATGMLAALVPAWIAARQDVVTALAGRRGITRSRRRWAVLGVALTALGGLTAAGGAWQVNAPLILAGLVVGELGLVLTTPAIVGLVARVGRFLPLAPRIALRDTSRNRTAAAPAISAVMAAVAGSLAVGVVYVADGLRSHEAYRPAGRVGSVLVWGDRSQTPNGNSPAMSAGPAAAAVRSVVPVVAFHDIAPLTCAKEQCDVSAKRPPANECRYVSLDRDLTKAEQRAARRDTRCAKVSNVYYGSLSNMTVLAGPDALGTLTNLPPEEVDRAAAALRAGAVLVSDALAVDHGRVSLSVQPYGEKENKPARTVTAPAYALPANAGAPELIVGEATARSLGLAPGTPMLLAGTRHMPTAAEIERLTAALQGVDGGLDPEVVRGPDPPGQQALIILAIVAGVITLGAAAIATGLAAADSRADLATLAAVGASPRVRRALSLSQSGVIAGLGSVLGALAGIGASTAVLGALNRGYVDVWPAPTAYPISVPWLNVGIAVLVVPVIAMLGAGLLTRSRLPIERRL